MLNPLQHLNSSINAIRLHTHFRCLTTSVIQVSKNVFAHVSCHVSCRGSPVETAFGLLKRASQLQSLSARMPKDPRCGCCNVRVLELRSSGRQRQKDCQDILCRLVRKARDLKSNWHGGLNNFHSPDPPLKGSMHYNNVEFRSCAEKHQILRNFLLALCTTPFCIPHPQYFDAFWDLRRCIMQRDAAKGS